MFGKTKRQSFDATTGVVTETKNLNSLEQLANEDQAAYDQAAIERIQHLAQWTVRLRKQARYYGGEKAKSNSNYAENRLRAVRRMTTTVSPALRPQADEAIETIRQMTHQLHTIQKMRCAADEHIRIQDRHTNNHNEDTDDESSDSHNPALFAATSILMPAV